MQSFAVVLDAVSVPARLSKIKHKFLQEWNSLHEILKWKLSCPMLICLLWALFFFLRTKGSILHGKLIINHILFNLCNLWTFFSIIHFRELWNQKSSLFMTLYYLYLPVLRRKPVKNHLYVLQSADSAEFYWKLSTLNKRRKQSMYLKIRI